MEVYSKEEDPEAERCLREEETEKAESGKHRTRVQVHAGSEEMRGVSEGGSVARR